MKRFSIYALGCIAIAQLVAVNVFSQQKETEEKQEKQQIIIRKKGNKKEKTTIVIDGDKVTVNGKPVEKGDKDIIVQKFNADEMILRMPEMSRMKKIPHVYGFDGFGKGDDFLKDFHFDFKEGALLGIISKENEKGAEVEEVMKETGAEKAGLQKADIIIKVDDQKIANPSDLSKAIAEKEPKDEVELTYLRNGKEQKTKVQLSEGKLPGELYHRQMELKHKDMQELQRKFQDRQFEFQFNHPENFGPFYAPGWQQKNGPQLGATIQDTEEGNGVKVLNTDKDSPAEKNGLLKDDLITEINGKKIANVRDAREALQQKSETNSWNVKVLRNGKTVNMEIKIPKKLHKAEL